MKKIILPALLLLSACASAPAGQMQASNENNICTDGYSIAEAVDPLGKFTVAPRTACRLEVDKSKAPAKQNP